MMKKQYEVITIEMLDIEVDDVIATSQPFNGEDQVFGNLIPLL